MSLVTERESLTFARFHRLRRTPALRRLVRETRLDPAMLVVKTILNGEIRQDYPINDMLFPVAQLVSLISRDMTLNPGDIILCGTSVGVGSMKPGSTIEVEIDGIGTLSNRFE